MFTRRITTLFRSSYAFARSADFEFELILYSRIETARHLVRSVFLQRSICRRVPRVKKKTDEIQKEHTHLTLSLSLSLSLSIRRWNVYFDVPAPVSLSLSLCKHGLDPDQIRMVFRIERFVNLKMCAYGRMILWNVRLCRAKADAHGKFEFWVLIGSSCNKID